jgi:spore maturation protein CgeB
VRIVYFTHSLASCWNHGNAHFLRGMLRELIARGHDVRVFEPEHAWSLENLLADHGPSGLTPYREAYPELRSKSFAADDSVEAMLDGADLVLVHEWNASELVARIGDLRRRGGSFTLLFHDTHHRAVSDAEAMRGYDLSGYDGILAFGEALAEVYRSWGWGRRAFVWHEAADVRLFRPPPSAGERAGLVWVGNWGDGERSREIEQYLLRPAGYARLPLDIYGVRYPAEALDLLAGHDAAYRGWLANAAAPSVYARHLATVHVPRRYYSTILPGIPTIRVFEALACGIPLVCAPWQDREGLFRPGEDFLTAKDGAQMADRLVALKHDPGLRHSLVRRGLETILSRHTCGHRADELLAIHASIAAPARRVA